MASRRIRWSDVSDDTDEEDSSFRVAVVAFVGDVSESPMVGERVIVQYMNDLIISDYYSKCLWRYFLSQRWDEYSELPKFVPEGLLVQFLIFNTLVRSTPFQHIPTPPLFCYFSHYLSLIYYK